MIAELLKYKYYALTVLLALIYIVAQSSYIHGDFNVFIAAAGYLKQGHNPYKVWLLLNGQVTDMFSYGPAFACLLIPFTYLPLKVAFVLFFLAQTLMLIRVFVLIERKNVAHSCA